MTSFVTPVGNSKQLHSNGPVFLVILSMLMLLSENVDNVLFYRVEFQHWLGEVDFHCAVGFALLFFIMLQLCWWCGNIWVDFIICSKMECQDDSCQTLWRYMNLLNLSIEHCGLFFYVCCYYCIVVIVSLSFSNYKFPVSSIGQDSMPPQRFRLSAVTSHYNLSSNLYNVYVFTFLLMDFSVRPPSVPLSVRDVDVLWAYVLIWK